MARVSLIGCARGITRLYYRKVYIEVMINIYTGGECYEMHKVQFSSSALENNEQDNWRYQIQMRSVWRCFQRRENQKG